MVRLPVGFLLKSCQKGSKKKKFDMEFLVVSTWIGRRKTILHFGQYCWLRKLCLEKIKMAKGKNIINNEGNTKFISFCDHWAMRRSLHKALSFARLLSLIRLDILFLSFLFSLTVRVKILLRKRLITFDHFHLVLSYLR